MQNEITLKLTKKELEALGNYALKASCEKDITKEEKAMNRALFLKLLEAYKAAMGK